MRTQAICPRFVKQQNVKVIKTLNQLYLFKSKLLRTSQLSHITVTSTYFWGLPCLTGCTVRHHRHIQHFNQQKQKTDDTGLCANQLSANFATRKERHFADPCSLESRQFPDFVFFYCGFVVRIISMASADTKLLNTLARKMGADSENVLK